MRSDLTTTGHGCPAHLVVEAAGGMEPPLEVPSRGRILAESAVREDSRVVGELAVRTFNGADAHALADEVL